MKSFHPGLFGGLGVAPTVLALSAMVGVDCSNSPPAGSAEGDASASDATVPPEDSSSPAKNEAGTDAAADGTVPEASVDAAPDAPIDAGQDSAGPPMQSCAPGGAGLTNCGSDAGESCCTSLEVSGGRTTGPMTVTPFFLRTGALSLPLTEALRAWAILRT